VASSTTNDPLLKRASKITGIIFDVDGVLTDGRIIYSDDGRELKQFNVQDGSSLKLLAEHGIDLAIITGRRSNVVARRARELGIQHVKQGASSKSTALNELIAEGFSTANNAAVGDDLQDLDVFNHPSVNFSFTVPNAHPVTLKHADYITQRRGGDGVVVEIAQLILTAQGKWAF